jgi:hypothetical protein
MVLRDSYKLFFAIPFDAATRSIYDDYVIPQLRSQYSGKLVCVVGNKQVGESQEYDEIETFKMQNSGLFTHFVTQIRNADIVIADLTDNNPNVHLELGIALSYNKNILRVTRKSYESLGFDVRDYEVEQYKTGGNLLEKIASYLDLYFKIKNLDFSHTNSTFYYSYPDKQFLNCWNQSAEKENIISGLQPGLSLRNTDFQMRDGKIRVDFCLTDQLTDDDWFGIYLRVGDLGINYGSILLYIRKNGSMEIVTYPLAKVLKTTNLEHRLSEAKTLLVEIEGDSINANLGDVNLQHTGLQIQSPGFIKLATYRSNAEYWNLQIVCHDTIEAFDKIGQ